MPKQVLTLLTKREIKAIEEEQGDTVQSLLNYIKQVRSAIDILEEDYDSFFNTVDTHFKDTGTEKEEELKIKDIIQKEKIVANQSKKNIEEK
jgi:predicted transcriptional regulator